MLEGDPSQSSEIPTDAQDASINYLIDDDTFESHYSCTLIFDHPDIVYGEDEWSFGFCEQGTGVFSCPAKKNPMYTYRESIALGKTNLSKSKVNQILRELSREWPGNCYDLLSKNCNHFCNEFCESLGVSKLPGWVNRFANAGDTAVEIAETTAMRFRQAKTEIVTASKVAYRFLSGITSKNNVTQGSPDSPGDTNRSNPRFQQPAWFKNLVAAGAKPSTSATLENGDDQVQKPQLLRQTASPRSREM
ncbi:uncharacterized protein LOC143616462 [Bidens hawaiensis]|uniref:uncharacterized protein LOC143616462 n=1 Tax=Bidens hawaiensis TaxID=980011 RepID=UPI00404B03D4